MRRLLVTCSKCQCADSTHTMHSCHCADSTHTMHSHTHNTHSTCTQGNVHRTEHRVEHVHSTFNRSAPSSTEASTSPWPRQQYAAPQQHTTRHSNVAPQQHPPTTGSPRFPATKRLYLRHIAPTLSRPPLACRTRGLAPGGNQRVVTEEGGSAKEVVCQVGAQEVVTQPSRQQHQLASTHQRLEASPAVVALWERRTWRTGSDARRTE